MKHSKNLIAGTLAFLTLVSCAVREGPPGGPEDKTPPTIITVEPPDGSALISQDAAFSIVFSEPMDKEATANAIFLSPVFWDYPRISWSGRKLTISPPEKLKPNTTYILTIGAGAPDFHGNKIGQSFSYAFSTGSMIDSGAVSGAIFSEERSRVTCDIWAYSLTDSAAIQFWKRIPDYATQVDSSGGFSLTNLTNGRYLIVALDDKNDDLFWDPQAEPLGLPPFLINLGSQQRYRGLIFRPSPMDTAAVTISEISPIDSRKIAVSFSRPTAKAARFQLNSYRIKLLDTDSLLEITGIYEVDKGQLILETEPQTQGQIYLLEPVNFLTDKDLPFDTTGARFPGIGDPDTIGPKLLKTLPADRASNVLEDSVIEMTFTERVKTLGFAQAVTVLADSTDTLGFLPVWTALNNVRMRFTTPIPHQKLITVALQPKNIFDAFNNPMPDSVLFFSFRLPPLDTAGAVIAQLEPAPTVSTYGLLTMMGKQEPDYQLRFNRQGELRSDAIMPGAYRFEFFEDLNGDGVWSPGRATPFEPAERFSFISDTLKVRSRWTTEIGTVSLPDIKQ